MGTGRQRRTRRVVRRSLVCGGRRGAPAGARAPRRPPRFVELGPRRHPYGDRRQHLRPLPRQTAALERLPARASATAASRRRPARRSTAASRRRAGRATRRARTRASFSSSSAACSQDCHLYNAYYQARTRSPRARHRAASRRVAAVRRLPRLPQHERQRVCESRREPAPRRRRLAARRRCTDCHDGAIRRRPGQPRRRRLRGAATRAWTCRPSPATCNTCHAASTFGAADCRSCHAAQVHNTAPERRHLHVVPRRGLPEARRRRWPARACHTNTPTFHHATAAPAVKSCRSCHAMKHAGAKVSGSRCADCHKGNAPSAKPRAQHSSTVTKKFVCSGCHSKKLHAKSEGASTTCRSCHKSKYHAGQARRRQLGVHQVPLVGQVARGRVSLRALPQVGRPRPDAVMRIWHAGATRATPAMTVPLASGA